MDIRKELLKAHSIYQTMKVVNYIDRDELLFDELMELFFRNEPVVAQRAAWAVGHCFRKYPWHIYPYLKRMLDHLNNDVHVALRRCTLVILSEVEIPEDIEGEVADLCFDILQSAREAIAVQASAMTALYNISQKYPELIPELKMAIEDIMPYASSGLKNRGMKILKKLNKNQDSQ